MPLSRLNTESRFCLRSVRDPSKVTEQRVPRDVSATRLIIPVSSVSILGPSSASAIALDPLSVSVLVLDPQSVSMLNRAPWYTGTARVLVSAIEAAVFAVPETRTAVLYVAKVDSTGQGAAGAAGAPTAALVHALLAHYLDPAMRPVRAARAWVHVFVRAQAQYLFLNSAEHTRKRVLGDVQLCARWARLFARVARELGDGYILGTDELTGLLCERQELLKSSLVLCWR
ncbi:hypothetical protein DFH11DRAFT_1768669 [Phellopilus nigrolimitatus]|nr:hypothetical protein DFH11DRAFT_1768669 [Phellopilus nigrolimitatus]